VPTPTPEPGCSQLAGFSYACDGGCGVGSTTVTDAGGGLIRLSPLGDEASADFQCSNGTGESLSNNLVIFGSPGHSMSLNVTGDGVFNLRGERPGASCTERCSRR
jgi:hypothetical protein